MKRHCVYPELRTMSSISSDSSLCATLTSPDGSRTDINHNDGQKEGPKKKMAAVPYDVTSHSGAAVCCTVLNKNNSSNLEILTHSFFASHSQSMSQQSLQTRCSDSDSCDRWHSISSFLFVPLGTMCIKLQGWTKYRGHLPIYTTPYSYKGLVSKWTSLLILLLLLDHIHSGAAGHLTKQFVSADKEKARSMESYKDAGTPSSGPGFFDVGAILCEKYDDWTSWSPCSRKCEQTRVRNCRKQEECGKSWIKEKRTCMRPKGACVPLTYKVIGTQRRNRMIEELLYDLLYDKWSEWGPCTRSCRQRRQRKCKFLDVCEHSYIQEERRCKIPGSLCEHRYSLKAVGKGEQQEGEEIPEVFSDTHDDDDDEDDDDDNEAYSEDDMEDISETGPTDSKDPSNGENNVLVSEVAPSTGHDSQMTILDNDVRLTGNNNDSLNIFSRKKWRPRKKRRRMKRKWPSSVGREFIQAQKTCGFRPVQGLRSYRVVGGREVIKNSWPWQVAILTKHGEQYCGGTLIAPRWVLTAAHCVRKKGKRRRLTVRVGEHNISDDNDITQKDIRPEKEFPHPNFDYNTITNDIALIKLRTPPPAFTLPGYACIPDVHYTPPRDQLCNIVGWGKLKDNHRFGSDTLMEAQVPVVRHKRCNKVFDYPITPYQVCAGYKRGGIDSCAGDSGGPLLCQTESGNGTNRYVIHGVTSYGEGCAKRGKYGIYTKVSSYLDWIYKTISDNR